MTNGSDAIVEIAGLSIATLGGKRVIDDLSIEILAGENRALVGESGSGKTTLALALMGRIRSGLVHEAGTIFVDGANVLSLKGSSLRRYRAETVSWLSQDPALSLTPHMTVRALLSESVPMDDEDALGLLGRVGLSGVKGLLDRRPRSLSGGRVDVWPSPRPSRRNLACLYSTSPLPASTEPPPMRSWPPSRESAPNRE